MKLLTKLLSNLAKQSKRKISSVQLKKQISIYRWLLYGFREVVRQHIELDESIFRTGGTQNESIMLEHEEIKSDIDNVILLAENSIAYKLRGKVLNKCAFDISEGVNRICKSIRMHMTEEDRLLKKNQSEI